MKVINFFGGPGAGKSTFSAGAYFYLRMLQYRTELVREYAKELVWDQVPTPWPQDHIFTTQRNRINRLANHSIDYVVTDSPCLLTTAYMLFNNDYSFALDRLARAAHKEHDHLNILCTHVWEDAYDEVGRVHSKDQSLEIQGLCRYALEDLGETYLELPRTSTYQDLVNILGGELDGQDYWYSAKH